MTLNTASARYGLHTRFLLAALLIGGCDRASESSEPAELTLADLYVLVEQPHEYEAWWRNFRRICASAPDPALCELGGEVFRRRCAGCHGALGVYERKGPSLLGLLGRTRSLLSGSTVVADEGYLRRAVQHHTADLEYVPGWKGTTYLPSGDPSALAYERHRKHLESKYYGLNYGTGDALDGLVALLAALSPTPGPVGTVSYELNGIDGDRAEAIRKEIEPRLESVHHCYAVARATSAALHGETGDPGKLVLGLEGSRDWRDVVTRRENIEHEFLLGCAADAMADVVAAAPWSGLPSSDIEVALTILPDSAEPVGVGPWTPVTVPRKGPYKRPKPPSDLFKPEDFLAALEEMTQARWMHHACRETEEPWRCDDAALTFANRCGRCHGMRGVQLRKAPSLVGLVGQERTFLNGKSTVADEDYVTRSIQDHFSADEYVPGWKGTLERELATKSGSGAWLDHVIRQEQSRGKYERLGVLDFVDERELASFVLRLSPETGGPDLGRVDVEVRDIENPQAATLLQEQLDWRRDSIQDCYFAELARESRVSASRRLEGTVSLPLVLARLLDFQYVAQRQYSFSNPVVLACVVDAVADAVEAALLVSPAQREAIEFGEVHVTLHDNGGDHPTALLRRQ